MGQLTEFFMKSAGGPPPGMGFSMPMMKGWVPRRIQPVSYTHLHHGVVLIGKFHLLLLCLHLGVGRKEVGVVCLYSILHTLTSQGERFPRLPMLCTCLADVVFVLPKTAKAELYAYPDKPHVYIAILRDEVLCIRTKEMILCHDSHRRQ